MKRIGSVVAAIFVLQLNAGLLWPQDSTHWPVVLQLPGMEKVRVEKKEYKSVDGILARMDVYYPPDFLRPRKLPVVVFVNGVGLPGLPDWRGNRDWGKLVALSGMIGVTYESRPFEIRDSEALLDHLLRHADELGMDASRIGIWTCSGHTLVGVPLALQQGRDYVRCAVIYYGAPDEIKFLRQDLSLFVVRAGLDEFRANRNIDRLVAKALDADIEFELVNYLSGHHAFDVADNTDRSREIIRATLDFLRQHLVQKPIKENRFVITAKNFYTMMRDGEVEKAKTVFLEKLKEIRSDRSNNPFYHREIIERGLNLTAQQLLQEGKIQESVETLHLMLEAYPLSPTAFLSAADGYRACGLTAVAIEKAEAALRLLDRADALSEDQKQSIRKSAAEKIERWKKEKS